MNTEITLNDLEDVLPALRGTRDEEFATSLYNQWTRKGYLSEKQMPWAVKFVEKARNPEPVSPKVEDPAEGESLLPLFGLFAKAIESGLKHPRVRVRDASTGSILTLSRAADSSSNPGHLYVKDEAGYVGKITPKGEARLTREAPSTVKPALIAMAVDPAAAALSYGRETGNCCFCSLQLTDERSVRAGYGPVCAEHYGLPWGE